MKKITLQQIFYDTGKYFNENTDRTYLDIRQIYKAVFKEAKKYEDIDKLEIQFKRGFMGYKYIAY